MYVKISKTMSIRNIVGDVEPRSILDIRQLLSPQDTENIIDVQEYRQNLEEMDLEITSAIQQIQNSSQNLDREISSFGLLDEFLYDQEGVSKIDDYIARLEDLLVSEELNAVTSSIALSTLGIFNLFKDVKDNTPNFQASLLPQYIQQAQESKAQAMTDYLLAESEREYSKQTLDLALQVLDKKNSLIHNLQEYNQKVVSRSSHLRRHFDVSDASGILDIYNTGLGASQLKRDTMHVEVENQAMRNLLDFTLECSVHM